jgi:UDP-N-acetylmuramyl pentapeptide phosphotransferase/UDP-N-acetylglucosamine-1-phosphate transferase
MDNFLEMTAVLSLAAGCLTYYLIPRFREMFIKANLYGVDLNKASGNKVPEATGVITGNFLRSGIFTLIFFKITAKLLSSGHWLMPIVKLVYLGITFGIARLLTL